MMMMGVGNPASSISSSSYCVLIPKTLKTHHLLFKINHTHNLHFHNQTPATPFTSCRLHARRKDTIAPPPPVVNDFDDDGEYDEFEDFDGDDIEEDEDEREFMPFGKMKKWLETKPRGFGEGKVYDTSIEDKLFEEIEQSRLAQAANVNNLKNANPATPSKTGHQTKKEPDAIPTGVRVRVVNLPKKKNIHRDLKSAFKDVRGILNIIPAVSGNKKTKDPICKGYAFVDFKLEEDAARFVQQFSRQSIAFGKIQKQIKCEMKNPNSSSSSDDESAGGFLPDIAKHEDLDDSFDDPPPMASVMEGEVNADIKMDDSFFEETVSDISKSHELDEDREDTTENVETLSTLDLSCSGSSESKSKMELATGSLSSKKKDKKRTSKKKINGKGGGQKVPKLDIPGSAKRLKIKEKAVLTDVFTKYGLKATSASTKES